MAALMNSSQLLARKFQGSCRFFAKVQRTGGISTVVDYTEKKFSDVIQDYVPPIAEMSKGDDHHRLAALIDQLPCRTRQLEVLLGLFGQKSHMTWAGMFVYGLAATGKTFTIATILRFLNLPHVIVNCVECYTLRLLYEITLNKISGITPSIHNGYSNFANCNNANDFVRHLRKAFEISNFRNSETYYIVLDKADCLRSVDIDIALFMRLQELMQMNLCVIMISQIVWEKYRPANGCNEPIQIYFPQYSKADICTILSHDPHDGYSNEFYENYLWVVLSVFHMVTNNLNELRSIAKQNFPKYVEPIESGLAVESNSRKLWHNIEPHLKQALSSVGMTGTIACAIRASANATPVPSKNRSELPFYSKYLLIAAYMASYNPLRTDRRFFVKRHEKIGKKAKVNSMKRDDRLTSHVLGPKVFHLDRLLAIFYSIVEDRVAPSAHIYSQISTLVALNLIVKIGRDDLDSPKYRCNVSLDFIHSVARTVDFDIGRYLYDFV